MTPHITQAAEKPIQSELDEVAYSVYLLTLDLRVAVAVVMTAMDGSLEEMSFCPSAQTCSNERSSSR